MKSRQRARRGRSDNSFWLSFSDLMSSLVLIIILVMFYIIYQYFNLAEINAAEIARREYQLEEAQTELESQQGKLTDAEKQMIAQQILLDAKEKELEDAQAILESQKAELESTQSQLSDKEIEIANQQAQLIALSGQLNTQKSQLDSQQAQLETQQAQITSQLLQLDSQKSQLDTQQSQINTQQAQLSTQQAQLENQQAQIEELVGMKTRIITSLSSALKNSSISATVDPANGSIALESDVLFESGQYKLSENGKDFIDAFLPVYLDVLFSEEYRPYVAEIIIEGHTDSDGGYLSNLELSQQRALAVASYVLGNNCRTVSSSIKTELRPVVTVNGRSYSDRIFDANGREDKAASRRVVFKFRLTDEQMIQQLRQILESN